MFRYFGQTIARQVLKILTPIAKPLCFTALKPTPTTLPKRAFSTQKLFPKPTLVTKFLEPASTTESTGSSTCKPIGLIAAIASPFVYCDPENDYYRKGLVEIQRQEWAKAIELFDRAIEQDPKNAAAYFKRGKAYAELGQYTKAIDSYNQAIQLDPNNPDIFVDRGFIYFALKQYNNAINSCNQAIQLDSKNAMAFFTRGLAYDGFGQYSNAIDSFKQVIQLHPNHSEAFIHCGMAYNNLRQYNNAIESYNQAIQLDPENSKAFFMRGTTYHNLGQYNNAIENYNQTIKLNSNNSSAFFMRGLAYNGLGQYSDAIVSFNQAIQLDPNNPSLFDNCGDAYLALKQYKNAIERYNQAIQLDSKNSNAFLRRGMAHIGLGEYKQAIESFNEAIELGPNKSRALIARGMIYGVLDQYQEAINSFDKAIELDPTNPAAFFERGVTHSKFDQHQQAINDFSKAIELNFTLPETFLERGVAHGKLAQYQQAIDDFSKAIELDPTHSSFFSNRGIAHSKFDQHQQAIDDFSKAIELDPTHSSFFYNRGIAHSKFDQHQQAIDDFSKAIELDPTHSSFFYNRGVIHTILGQYQQAIEDFNQAIIKGANNPVIIFCRSWAYLSLKNSIIDDPELQRKLEKLEKELDGHKKILRTVRDTYQDFYDELLRSCRSLKDWRELLPKLSMFFNIKAELGESVYEYFSDILAAYTAHSHEESIHPAIASIIAGIYFHVKGKHKRNPNEKVNNGPCGLMEYQKAADYYSRVIHELNSKPSQDQNNTKKTDPNDKLSDKFLGALANYYRAETYAAVAHEMTKETPQEKLKQGLLMLLAVSDVRAALDANQFKAAHSNLQKKILILYSELAYGLEKFLDEQKLSRESIDYDDPLMPGKRHVKIEKLDKAGDKLKISIISRENNQEEYSLKLFKFYESTKYSQEKRLAGWITYRRDEASQSPPEMYISCCGSKGPMHPFFTEDWQNSDWKNYNIPYWPFNSAEKNLVTLDKAPFNLKSDETTNTETVLESQPSSPKNYQAYRGFVEWFENGWNHQNGLEKKLEELSQEQGISLNEVDFRIVGHSAGGAKAQLTALAIKTLYNPTIDIQLVTQGAPMVFNNDASAHFDTEIKKKNHTRINNGDVVTYGPIWLGLIHTGHEVDVLKSNSDDNETFEPFKSEFTHICRNLFKNHFSTTTFMIGILGLLCGVGISILTKQGINKLLNPSRVMNPRMERIVKHLGLSFAGLFSVGIGGLAMFAEMLHKELKPRHDLFHYFQRFKIPEMYFWSSLSDVLAQESSFIKKEAKLDIDKILSCDGDKK